VLPETIFVWIKDICGDHLAASPVPFLISISVSIWVPGVRAILFLKLILIVMDLIFVLRDLWRS
jgi:hypothetical protein